MMARAVELVPRSSGERSGLKKDCIISSLSRMASLSVLVNAEWATRALMRKALSDARADGGLVALVRLWRGFARRYEEGVHALSQPISQGKQSDSLKSV